MRVVGMKVVGVSVVMAIAALAASSSPVRASDEWNQQLFTLPAIKLQERTKRVTRLGAAVGALYLTILNQVGHPSQVVLADPSRQVIYCTDVETCRRDVAKKEGETEIRKATCSKVEVSGKDVELECKLPGADGLEHALSADEESYELD